MESVLRGTLSMFVSAMRKALWLLTVTLGSACADDSSADEHSSRDAGDESVCTATIALLDYKLDPKTVEVDKGSITLCAENKGQAPHDLAVRDAGGETLGRTIVLQPNASDSLTVELEPGTYTIYCTQGGHESLGMKGMLTVR